MDSRKESFIRKFSDAQKYLDSSSIYDLVSIKYRDNVNDSEYHNFIASYLQSELNLKIKQIDGDFQGRGWLVADKSHNKVLLVEHETGLEILYIAGSIASLLSLIPLINSGWKFVHRRFHDHSFFNDAGTELEIRVVNSKNQLIEQHVLSIDDYILTESMKEIETLKTRVEQLEQELKGIKDKAKKSNSKKSVKSKQKPAS